MKVKIQISISSSLLLPLLASICLSLGETALPEARLNTDSDVRWDHGPELFNITSVDNNVSTDSSGDDIAWESEKVVGNLGGTWVFVVETSDEDGLTAVWVEFLVDGTLWEDVQLEGGDVGVDDTGTVLKDNGGYQVTNDCNVEFGSTWMGVWSVETAWA